MNVIYDIDSESLATLKEKYVVLELDTFRSDDKKITAYCLVEQIPILSLETVEQYQSLHSNLMKNYRLRNWQFCEDAIEHLAPQWGGELKSFYEILLRRVQELKTQELDESWDGSIAKAS